MRLNFIPFSVSNRDQRSSYCFEFSVILDRNCDSYNLGTLTPLFHLVVLYSYTSRVGTGDLMRRQICLNVSIVPIGLEFFLPSASAVPMFDMGLRSLTCSVIEWTLIYRQRSGENVITRISHVCVSPARNSTTITLALSPS